MRNCRLKKIKNKELENWKMEKSKYKKIEE